MWKDRRRVYMLNDTNPPPAEGNFCDDNNRPVKPHIVERYNRHLVYVDISDLMANSYSISRRNLNWAKKVFSHTLDLIVFNRWILLSSCGAKYTQRGFKLLLVRKFIEEAKIVPPPVWLEDQLLLQHNQHWPAKSTKCCCRLSTSRGQRKGMVLSTPNMTWACAWCIVSRRTIPK